jgi:AcrR family transcriptional regulator
MTPEMARADLVKEATAPPRARILKAARDLFYRCGIHAVGVDAIAEAADTNKTTLYRHFESKDELVAECLRGLGREFDTAWAEIERAHAGQPKDQLLAWLRFIAEFKLGPSERGCAFANAAVELPDANHPARRVIEEFKSRHRDLIIELCRKAGLRDPELLADELFLLCEGARSTIQSLGPRAPPNASPKCSKRWSQRIRPRDPDCAGPAAHVLSGPATPGCNRV